MLTDAGSGKEGTARADRTVCADADRADAEDVAVDPVAGEVDFRFDGCPVADLEHAGDGRQRVQVNVVVDLRAERSGVVGDPRGASQAHRADEVCGLLGHP